MNIGLWGKIIHTHSNKLKYYRNVWWKKQSSDFEFGHIPPLSEIYYLYVCMYTYLFSSFSIGLKYMVYDTRSVKLILKIILEVKAKYWYTYNF